jgi:two-component system, chemotaxis family, CheB/CheR fusion protein
LVEIELRSLIEKAYSSRSTVEVNKVEKRSRDGKAKYFDVRLKLIQDSSKVPIGLSVAFQDETEHYLLKDELEHSKHELKAAYEEFSVSKRGTTTDLSLTSINRRGKSIKVRVPILPLLKAGSEIDGLIIMMEEFDR